MGGAGDIWATFYSESHVSPFEHSIHPFMMRIWIKVLTVAVPFAFYKTVPQMTIISLASGTVGCFKAAIVMRNADGIRQLMISLSQRIFLGNTQRKDAKARAGW